jgi:hypothetical protein
VTDPRQREAPSEVRQFAKRVRDLYAAFIQEGFDEYDARAMLNMPILMHLNGFRINPEDLTND